MPYIKQESRDFFTLRTAEFPINKSLDTLQFVGGTAENAGDLNYAFTKIALCYLENKGLKYQYFNDIIGALEGAKLELYRRHCAPYEDLKIQKNGDVEV